MLQHDFFEESTKEGMISILSVLTERQRIRKSTIRKTPAETPRSDQQSLISSFLWRIGLLKKNKLHKHKEEKRVMWRWHLNQKLLEISLIELLKQLIEYFSQLHKYVYSKFCYIFQSPPLWITKIFQSPHPLDFQKISIPPFISSQALYQLQMTDPLAT